MSHCCAGQSCQPGFVNGSARARIPTKAVNVDNELVVLGAISQVYYILLALVYKSLQTERHTRQGLEGRIDQMHESNRQFAPARPEEQANIKARVVAVYSA